MENIFSTVWKFIRNKHSLSGNLSFLFRHAFLIKTWLLMLDSMIYLPYYIARNRCIYAFSCLYSVSQSMSTSSIQFWAMVKQTFGTDHRAFLAIQHQSCNYSINSSQICPIFYISDIITLVQVLVSLTWILAIST